MQQGIHTTAELRTIDACARTYRRGQVCGDKDVFKFAQPDANIEGHVTQSIDWTWIAMQWARRMFSNPPDELLASSASWQLKQSPETPMRLASSGWQLRQSPKMPMHMQ